MVTDAEIAQHIRAYLSGSGSFKQMSEAVCRAACDDDVSDFVEDAECLLWEWTYGKEHGLAAPNIDDLMRKELDELCSTVEC